MEITGQIYRIDAPVENNGHKSRNFVLYVNNPRNEQYSDYLQFELYGDKCAILDMYQMGETVKVSFDLRGRKYQKRDGSGEGFFTSLSAYAINNPMQQPFHQTPQLGQPQQPLFNPDGTPANVPTDAPF